MKQKKLVGIDIAKFHACNDDLYWYDCYDSDKNFKKFVTSESFAHPAKASFLLMDRIFKHLKSLGLLKKGDVVVDFMSGTGRTGTMAAFHGYDSIHVEFEEHFIHMIKNNYEKLKKEGQFCRCDDND